jgi:4-diphosphocytidyl-2-C-methyl-D-erythritol kinase
MVTEFAAAKINLALHVTGRRGDGYHLLDSAVMFAADVGDELMLEQADETSLQIVGPFSAGLETDANNLVLKAHAALAARFPGQVAHARMKLTKALPVASGIGGGSADAAAALRALVRANDLNVDTVNLEKIALALGADVPVCLSSKACRMRGIGEMIDEWSPPPALHAVLVNPLVGVSTAAIFKALALPPGSAAHDAIADRFGGNQGTTDCLAWLAQCRNDLEPAACKIEPVISSVLNSIARLDGCSLSRMSGSGATCFGLFEDRSKASAAATHLQASYPDWWVAPTRLV